MVQTTSNAAKIAAKANELAYATDAKAAKYGGGDGLVWASVNNNVPASVGFYACDTLRYTVNCRFCIHAIGHYATS